MCTPEQLRTPCPTPGPTKPAPGPTKPAPGPTPTSAGNSSAAGGSTTAAPSDAPGSNRVMIIGIAVGSMLVIILGVVGYIVWNRRRTKTYARFQGIGDFYDAGQDKEEDPDGWD